MEEVGDGDVVAADERQVPPEREPALRHDSQRPQHQLVPPAMIAVGGSGRSSSRRVAAAPCSTENTPSSAV